MGNPLSYRDGMIFEWANGRNLQSITKGNDTITMQYNANGMRTRQDSDDYTLHYYYDSNNNLTGLNFNGNMLYFYFDSDGNATSFKYADTMYYYIKNLQGDVVKIIDRLGNTKVTYTYDAWGKVLSQTDTSIYNLANLNPFRYRGYAYDYQTGLYYLQSRYYDPITGRFLNADDTKYINAKLLTSNLYTYCTNNFVNYIDTKGNYGLFNFSPVPFYPAPVMSLNSIRQLIYDAACIYLTNKHYDITKILFFYALFGDGHTIGPEVKEKIIIKLIQDRKFMKEVVKGKNFSYEFPEGDLYYSIHKTNVKSKLKSDSYGIYFKVELGDDFDFTEFWDIIDDSGINFGAIVNNFGTVLSSVNIDLVKHFCNTSV